MTMSNLNSNQNSYRLLNSEVEDDVQRATKILRSSLISRNVTVMGHRTSIRLEPEMWNAMKDIARRERCTIHELCSLIHLRKAEITSLTAAIRVFLMLYYRAAATEDGHARVGHGSFETMKRRAKILGDLNSSHG